jgi:hypothetical protein
MHTAVSLIDHLNPTPWATPLPDPTRAMLHSFECGDQSVRTKPQRRQDRRRRWRRYVTFF